MSALAAFAALVVAGSACDGPLHPEALVVYNPNAGSSAQALAQYYATQRGIAAGNLCPVELPPGLYARPEHLLAARKTIVETCICSVIPELSRPTPCSLTNLEAVRLASPITHLVFIRGMPARLYGTPWPSDSEEPSFDFYLSYLTYRSENIFAAGTGGFTSNTYLTADLLQQDSEVMILSAPKLSTALHREVAHGRVEAIDEARTRQLIDRTVEAERLGITGRFFEERANKSFRFLQATTGAHAAACYDYTTHQPFLPGTPESTWNPDLCRAGTTWTSSKGPDNGTTTDDPINNILPGRWMSTIPWAVQGGLVLGSAPNPNSHSGFNDFSSLTRWRKTTATCTPLCKDLPTQVERDQCAATSSDHFRELNTSCVGAARGLIGHQVRSYPVQYYGFFPANWEVRTGGAVEKTPPEIRSGGAYLDGFFTDDRYLHLGTHAVDDPDQSECTLSDGSVAACRERIALHMDHRLAFPTPLPVAGSRAFLLRVRHRNAASPAGQLRMTVTFEGGAVPVTKEALIPLAAENLDWAIGDVPILLSSAEAPQVTAITVAFATRLQDQVEGFLDLDGIELFDFTDFVQRLPREVGSFDPPAQDATHWGDWAANAIDRLGAVAWWGSSSHHVTAGWAYSEESRFYGAFFMGRTLGESLLLMAGGESGLVYGDPLYRPVAVRMHVPGQSGYGKAPGAAVGPANQATFGTVRLEVLHGTATVTSVNWSVSTCPVLDPAICNDGSMWTVRQAGTGGVTGFPVTWTSFIDPGVEQDVLLRLRVWNSGQASDELFHYAYFHWTP
jgi:hypothetical protein